MRDARDWPEVAERVRRAPRPSQGTPYLLVDWAVCAENIRTAAEYFRDAPVALRPHFKAHKCLELLRRQVAAGGCAGVTCATGWEAKALADAGFDDILVANEVVDPEELLTLTAAAAAAHVTVAVDAGAQVQLLEAAAAAAGTPFGVLIEVDVGLHRCGLTLGDGDLVGLARSVVQSEYLSFEGLLGYEGHAALEPSLATRSALVAAAAGLLRMARDALGSARIGVPVISGGSTGTFDLACDQAVWTEIEAGSYVLMDASYAQLGLPFQVALYCVGTLISRNGNRGVVNVGLKHLSVEYGLPTALDPSIEVLGLSDEHARVAIGGGNPLRVGDAVLVIPSHVDPSINLHESLVVWLGGEELERWPVYRSSRMSQGSSTGGDETGATVRA